MIKAVAYNAIVQLHFIQKVYRQSILILRVLLSKSIHYYLCNQILLYLCLNLENYHMNYWLHSTKSLYSINCYWSNTANNFFYMSI